MLNTAPPLGTRVVVSAEKHERQGDAGQCHGYHGRLQDCIYVLFDEEPYLDLVPLPYLDLEGA